MKMKFRILVLTISALTSINLLNAQWVQQNSGTNEMLTDVAMLDTATAIAVGRDGSILRTSNAGTTWTNVAAPLSFGGPWNGVSFFDTMYGIVVGDHGLVMTTINGGQNWIGDVIPLDQKCLSALHVGPANIYVGADSGWICHSVDSGKTWSSEKISSLPIRSLFAWRGTYVWGLPIYALTPYSLCAKMEFPSSPRNETILTDFQGMGSEAFSGEFCNGGGAGLIVGVQGDKRAAPAIIRKAMSDTVWREVSTDISQDGTLLGVSAPSENVIYVCGSDGMVFKSTNGGDTWIAAAVPTTRNLNAIYFFDETQGFAVGDSGVILYTSNGRVTNVSDQECHLPIKFMLEQNYPNPFNAETTIRYQLPSAGHVNLDIYNMQGQRIRKLLNREQAIGSYQIMWDSKNDEGTGVASGIYFLQIKTGGWARTIKMVLIR